MNNEYKDGEVTGIDKDGNLILWNATTKRNENSGETPQEFGVENITDTELSRIMYAKGMTVLSKDKQKRGKLTVKTIQEYHEMIKSRALTKKVIKIIKEHA